MIQTVVVGAGGYSGAELVGLLSAHEHAAIAGLFGSEKGAAAGTRMFHREFPRFRGVVEQPIQPTSVDAILSLNPQAVFLATPHETSHELVPALLENDIVVLDLSAAFRLGDPAMYPLHYGFSHKHANLLSSAAYGLPERFREQIRAAQLIALPGCYPTSIILPMAALVDAGAIDLSQPIVADCVSGVSGAGRSAVTKSLFCEVSYQPYGVLSHRHAPEIDQYVGSNVIFTPHLGPFDRGIVSTIHAQLSPKWNERGVRDVLEQAYGDEPFVRLLESGQWPSVSAVRGTNFCDIALAVDAKSSHLIVVSAIDNLLKGAAGQAVQCFNERFNLPSNAGFSGGVTCFAN